MGRGLPSGLTQPRSRSPEQAQPCRVTHQLFHTPVRGGAVRPGCVGLGWGPPSALPHTCGGRRGAPGMCGAQEGSPIRSSSHLWGEERCARDVWGWGGVPHLLFHTPVRGGALRLGCVGLGRCPPSALPHTCGGRRGAPGMCGVGEGSARAQQQHFRQAARQGGCDLWEEVDYQEEGSWQPPETPKSSHGGKGSWACTWV